MERLRMRQHDAVQFKIFRGRISPSLISLDENDVVKPLETMNSFQRGLRMPGLNREIAQACKQIKVGGIEAWKIGDKRKHCA